MLEDSIPITSLAWPDPFGEWSVTVRSEASPERGVAEGLHSLKSLTASVIDKASPLIYGQSNNPYVAKICRQFYYNSFAYWRPLLL